MPKEFVEVDGETFEVGPAENPDSIHRALHDMDEARDVTEKGIMTFEYEHQADLTGEVLDGGEDIPVTDLPELLRIFKERVDKLYVNDDGQIYDDDVVFVIKNLKEEL